jgi:hypothetical protein
LARVVRDGGFKIALIVRLSAIPGHFTTAVFSTCGMGIFVFALATLLSMPKQFIGVYLGVILEQSNTGTENVKSRVVSDVVLAITFIITIAAMWYILHLMNAVKRQVVYEKRKARGVKLLQARLTPYSNEGFLSSTTDVFHPDISDSDIPLKMSHQADSRYQQWDRHGKAVGYAADPSIIHTPKPQVANATFLPLPYPRDVEQGGNMTGKHDRQESTDVIGWHQDGPHSDQFSDPYASDSFVQNPSSSSITIPYLSNQQRDVQQTPTPSHFVNGPVLTTTTPPHFDRSTTSFGTAPSSPHQSPPQEHQDPFYNPYPPPDQQPSSQPGFSQSSPQPRSPPPPSYPTNLR